jgi:WD40 repeat protein
MADGSDNVFASASDDGTIVVWDIRDKAKIVSLIVGMCVILQLEKS